jgi:ketosteroid isomerase-like protein
MPDADFDVIRRAWDAVSRGDEDGMLREYHPEIVTVPLGAAMEGIRYRGPDEVMGWFQEEIVPNWETFVVIPERFRRVGEKVLVTGRWLARGRGSGVELDLAATWVIEVRDGKIAYWQTYTDHEQALREVGLDGAAEA